MSSAPPRPPPPPPPQWEATRQAARAARKPSGSTMATSFSSKQPMHGWEPEHAVRELWQNMRDGLLESFGVADIQPSSGDAGLVSLSIHGHCVGHVDVSMPDRLVFKQMYAVLQPQHLLLASTKNAPGSTASVHVAGCHGEGFKVAVNYLLQLGYSVTYEMDGQVWEFSHAPEPGCDVLTMVVRTTHVEAPRDHLLIDIRGPGANKLFNVGIDWELLRLQPLSTGRQEPTVRVDRQELVLTTAPELAGRVYNRCLFVNTCERLRGLGLAVNLDIGLPRDRHELPANLHDKVAAVIRGAVARNSQSDIDFCDRLIQRFKECSGADAETLAISMRSVLQNFCAKQRGVPFQSILFLAGDCGGDAALLEQFGCVIFPHAGALAEKIDVENYIQGHIAKLPNAQVPSDGARNFLESLQTLVRTMQTVGNYWPNGEGRPIPVTPKAFSANFPFCKLSRSLAYPWSRELYITASYIEVANEWRGAALQLFSELLSQMTLTMRAALSSSSMLTDFQSDPRGFDLRRYSSLSAVGGDSGNGRVAGSPSPSPIQQASSASGRSVSSASSPIAVPPAMTAATLPVAPDARRTPSAVPSTLRPGRLDVQQPTCVGPMTSFGGFHEGYQDHSVQCHVPSFEMVSHTRRITSRDRGAETVTVLVEAGLAFTPDDWLRFFYSLPTFHFNLQQLRFNLVEPLGLPRPVELFYVVCNPALLGWCCQGGIYLNLMRILDVNVHDADAVRETFEALMQTVLHEVAHWRYPQHNTHFADHLARVVWACRKLL